MKELFEDDYDKYDYDSQGESEQGETQDADCEHECSEQDGHDYVPSINNGYENATITASGTVAQDVAGYSSQDTYASQFVTENVPNEVHSNGSQVPFVGAGRCDCGCCGSFVGSGSICEACGHDWDAHSRYKK